MKTFATFLVFVSLLAGSISAQQNATATHLYTRAELQSLPKDKLVDVAYALQRRVVLDEAPTVKAQPVLATTLSTPAPNTEPAHRRSPLLAFIGAVAAGLFLTGAMSREQSTYIGNPISVTNRQVVTSSTGRRILQAPTTIVSTPGPNPQAETCRYLGAGSTVLQAAVTIWGKDWITNDQRQIAFDGSGEALNLTQAVFGCNLPGPTNVTQSTPTSLASASNIFAMRPQAATPTTTSTTVASSVHTKQCNGYSNLGTFFTGSNTNWSRFPRIPLRSIAQTSKEQDPYTASDDTDFHVRYAFAVADADGNNVTSEGPAGPEYHVVVRKGQTLNVDRPVIPADAGGATGWLVYVSKGLGQSNRETLQTVTGDDNKPKAVPLDTKEWPLVKWVDHTPGWLGTGRTQAKDPAQDNGATQAGSTPALAALPVPPSPAPSELGSQIGSILGTIAKAIHTGWCNNIQPNITTAPTP